MNKRINSGDPSPKVSVPCPDSCSMCCNQLGQCQPSILTCDFKRVYDFSILLVLFIIGVSFLIAIPILMKCFTFLSFHPIIKNHSCCELMAIYVCKSCCQMEDENKEKEEDEIQLQ